MNVLGTFGDSLTTAPSYEEPLANYLGAQILENATGGWTTTNLLASLPSYQSQHSDRSMILCGVNDLIAGGSVVGITGRLGQIMAITPNPRVCTILPFGNNANWTAARELVRAGVNEWIMTQQYPVNAESMGDGDPTQPALKPEYDGGDGLHLTNPVGDDALAALMEAQGNW
jgi:hypothetical protein